jgi:hypothetical protein
MNRIPPKNDATQNKIEEWELELFTVVRGAALDVIFECYVANSGTRFYRMIDVVSCTLTILSLCSPAFWRRQRHCRSILTHVCGVKSPNPLVLTIFSEVTEHISVVYPDTWRNSNSQSIKNCFNWEKNTE